MAKRGQSCDSDIPLMAIYRPHRGNFDAWRRYKVEVDGTTTYQLADGQVLWLPGTTHSLSVVAGAFQLRDVLVAVHDDEKVICELASNPRGSGDPIKVLVLADKEFHERLLRFDKPPYIGGRFGGLMSAVTSTVITLGVAIMAVSICLGLLIRFANQKDILSFLFVATAGTTFWCIVGFVAAAGIRSLFYYFRLPRQWRH